LQNNVSQSIQKNSGIASINQSTQFKQRNDAWIWTQNPADYTIQLVSLSKQTAVQEFIRTHKIKQYSTQFAINSNGKRLYVLIYGVYADKRSAEQAKTLLAGKMSPVKPWVRRFSDIHGLMSGQ